VLNTDSRSRFQEDEDVDLKRILSVALVSAVIASTVAIGSLEAGTEQSEALASHSLKSLDGSEIKLSSFKGEVVVVNFWASWCAPCRKELPVMDGWNKAWAGRGARVVAISIDKEERKARRFAEDTGLSLTLIHDGPSGLAKALDLPSLPCTYVLDRDGEVVSVIRSSSAEDLAKVERKVESLLASSRKVQKATAPVGGAQ